MFLQYLQEGLSHNNSHIQKFSINLFVKIANQINSQKSSEKEKQNKFSNFYEILKIFVDLYLTLDSYASHLIKVTSFFI